MTISRFTTGLAERSANASLLLGTAAATLLLAGTVSARADEHLVLVDKIAVPAGSPPKTNCTAVPGTGLGAFDISFADPKTGLYVLSDRTNGAVDFFDASDDTYIGRVGGFAGVQCKADGMTANNNISGPDGVIIVGGEVWAGDGDSTLKVIDIKTFNITDTITVTDPNNPNVKMRVDEMAYDARDHILAAANNANVPAVRDAGQHRYASDSRPDRVRWYQWDAQCHQYRHRAVAVVATDRPVLRLRPEYRPE